MADRVGKLQFSPKNWQIGYYRSSHTWLLQITMWHYWFVFTFICLLNFYFYYLYKTVTYARADVRGKRAVGDRRRVAWPEVFIILLPLFWASSIIFQGFIYLRVLEHNGAYAGLSVQIFGYQWGWRYCYNESTYLKLIANPRRAGRQFFSILDNTQSDILTLNPDKDWGPVRFRYAVRAYREYVRIALWVGVEPWNLRPFPLESIASDPETKKQPSLTQKEALVTKEPRTSAEIYYMRQVLANAGVLPNPRVSSFKNQLFQTGLWLSAQGLDPNALVVDAGERKFVADPLRLLRSTNALVLPTRLTIRFMGSGQDVTHSWAVPGIGLKIDCVPGRVFYVFNIIMREGVYYGQCSELCGWNHYNMPIILYALPLDHFLIWWELELHQVLTENRAIPQHLTLDECDSVSNYSLINKKYK
jgi:heme/copper-type cytochrome/quinol oxidase subunit 2